MKKYHVSSFYIDRCISKIESNCFLNPDGAFTGNELAVFCGNPKRLYALHLLEAAGEIKMARANNSDLPCAVWLENKGMLHSYTKWQKIKSSFIGFISGVATTLLAQLLLHYLTSL